MDRHLLEAQLIEALQRLAQSAPEQERWVRAETVWPSLDELALTFDDVQGAALALEADGYFAHGAAEQIGRVDGRLAEMSGDSDVWEAAALRSDPAWEELRRLATRALESLNAVRV